MTILVEFLQQISTKETTRDLEMVDFLAPKVHFGHIMVLCTAGWSLEGVHLRALVLPPLYGKQINPRF